MHRLQPRMCKVCTCRRCTGYSQECAYSDHKKRSAVLNQNMIARVFTYLSLPSTSPHIWLISSLRTSISSDIVSVLITRCCWNLCDLPVLLSTSLFRLRPASQKTNCTRTRECGCGRRNGSNQQRPRASLKNHGNIPPPQPSRGCFPCLQCLPLTQLCLCLCWAI